MSERFGEILSQSGNKRGTDDRVLANVPAQQRDLVLTGMRWSVWLSSLAVPCGAAINLLLARVSPETIGTYGLLGVYTGLTATFLYFGGDAVLMRFIPECSRETRLSFLFSYLLVVVAVLVPWLVFAYLCPAAVGWVLGEDANGWFGFLILCLAPVPISFMMVVACLKGMLEIRASQTLAKSLPIISLLVYGLLFLVARPLLASHPTAIIWGVYLGLTGVLLIVGAVYVLRLCGRPQVRFYLPSGFWRYAFDTQQVSAVYYLNRVDYVLVLNFGGLAMLGRYVAVMTVAAVVPKMSALVMDTLLPSLTNMIAARNHSGAGQVFMLHMRVLLLVTVALTCAIMLLAVPITSAMGAKYRSVEGLITLMAMFQGIASPGLFGGTLLASIGRQRLAVWTGLLNLALFSFIFIGTWHRWNLSGAIVAYGLAILVSNSTLMAIALRTATIYPSIGGLWLKAALVQVAVGVIAFWPIPRGLTITVLVWLGGMALFFWLAHYNVAEIEGLVRTFAPNFSLRLRQALAAHAEKTVEPGVASD